MGESNKWITVSPISEFSVSVYHVGNNLKVTCGLICSTSVTTHELFLVQEGAVIFIDNKKFKVLKDGISK